MPRYLVKQNPHFRDATLHPVGSEITLAAPLENEKDWADYLERLDPEPVKPVVKTAAQLKADAAQFAAQAKAAAEAAVAAEKAEAALAVKPEVK